MYDLVVKNGLLIDPAQGIHERKDVALLDGKVAAVEPRIDESQARRVVDAEGLIVTPGLIDLHVHVCYRIAPLAVDPEAACLAKGSTTVLDVGSLGNLLFEGFRRYIIDRSPTRIYALLNVGSLGLIGTAPGEHWPMLYNDTFATSLFINPDETTRVIEANRDVILGIKWHNTYGRRALAAARRAADASGGIIMAENHYQPETLYFLNRGDILTHIYHPHRTHGVLDPDGKVPSEYYTAMKRGVLFDVGHGAGSFAWNVAEKAIPQGIRPDTISTDLHTGSINGPAFDMPTTMAKFLHLGFTLDEVVKASTARPAEALGKLGEIGTLKPGGAGDVAVFKLEEGKFPLVDVLKQERMGSQRLVPVTVIKGGEIYRDARQR
ncbi:MAG: amidohydrolase/deacetylase family metallohydrolase [Candidatus Bathyarchaeia archaeon]